MAEKVSIEEIRAALAPVKHPAIDCSLIDLGIVQEIVVDGGQAEITLAFPFPNIPIADLLIDSVKAPLKTLGITVKVKTSVMDKEQVQRFLTLEKENWKGTI